MSLRHALLPLMVAAALPLAAIAAPHGLQPRELVTLERRNPNLVYLYLKRPR